MFRDLPGRFSPPERRQPMSETSYEVEKEAVRKAILDCYHEGHVKWDPELYKNILHPDWKFFMLDEGGELQIVDRAKYCSWYDPQNADPELEWETEFYSIDVTGNVGAVKIRLENQKVRYIDYFNVMKVDGKWWIMHKVSHGVHKSD
jgi:hypothetical protein